MSTHQITTESAQKTSAQSSKPISRPRVLVLTGYGINCDEETAFAFDAAGAQSKIVHINDLIERHERLQDYQVLVFPGGFSYGDHTGSGIALANKIRNHFWDEVLGFVEKDHLVIGICNGFQVMVNLGLLPALDGDYGRRDVALVHNDRARYLDRWVDLRFDGNSPWVQGIATMSVPIAHGEGKIYSDRATLEDIDRRGLITARYVQGEMCRYQNLDANPNGSALDIAAMTDCSGRLIGMMPHPERAIDFTHLPNWTLTKEQYARQGKKLPSEGPGMKLFRNAVEYFG